MLLLCTCYISLLKNVDELDWQHMTWRCYALPFIGTLMHSFAFLWQSSTPVGPLTNMRHGCHVYFGKFTQVHISISHQVKPCCWSSMHDVKYVLKSCLSYCMWYNHWLLWNNVNSTTGWQVVPGVCWLSLGEIDCKEGAAPKKPFHICLQILPNYQPNEK